MTKEKSEVRFLDDKLHNSLEILIPPGISHKELSRITLGDLLSKFRPSGCPACLSGQDFRIRERFERVLPVDIRGGEIHF